MNSRHTAHFRWSSRSSMPAGAPAGGPAAPRGDARAGTGPGAASIASRLRLTPWRARAGLLAPRRATKSLVLQVGCAYWHSNPLWASVQAPGPGQRAAERRTGVQTTCGGTGAGGASAWGLPNASGRRTGPGRCKACAGLRKGAGRRLLLRRRARLLGRPQGLLLARVAVARVIVLRDARARSEAARSGMALGRERSRRPRAWPGTHTAHSLLGTSECRRGCRLRTATLACAPNGKPGSAPTVGTSTMAQHRTLAGHARTNSAVTRKRAGPP